MIIVSCYDVYLSETAFQEREKCTNNAWLNHLILIYSMKNKDCQFCLHCDFKDNFSDVTNCLTSPMFGAGLTVWLTNGTVQGKV